MLQINHIKDLKIKECNIKLASVSQTASYALNKDEYVKLNEEFTKLAELYYEHVLENETPIRLLNFTGTMKDILFKNKKKYFCSFANNQTSISYKGDIYPCACFVGKQDYKLGNVNDKTYDAKRVAQYDNSLNVDNKEVCKSCFAKDFCGGGCSYEALITNGNIYEPFEQGCDLIRHTVALSMDLYTKLYKVDKHKLLKIILKSQADIDEFMKTA